MFALRLLFGRRSMQVDVGGLMVSSVVTMNKRDDGKKTLELFRLRLARQVRFSSKSIE